MSIILNIESSNSVCSVCIAENGTPTVTKETTEANRHSELLATFVQEVLTTAGITADQLDAVAVSIGPGSYTGLRIGVSLTKGIAYSANLPVIAVPTLKSIAWAAQKGLSSEKEFSICPMIDARRMEVYSQLFDEKLEQLNQAEAVIVEQSSYNAPLAKGPVYFCGNGAEKCKEILIHENAHFLTIENSSHYLAYLSHQQYILRDFVDTAYFEPFYLKQFSTTVSKKKLL